MTLTRSRGPSDETHTTSDAMYLHDISAVNLLSAEEDPGRPDRRSQPTRTARRDRAELIQEIHARCARCAVAPFGGGAPLALRAGQRTRAQPERAG